MINVKMKLMIGCIIQFIEILSSVVVARLRLGALAGLFLLNLNSRLLILIKLIFLSGFSGFASSNVEVFAKKCDFDKREVVFEIRNNLNDNIIVYLSDLPWSYPLNMNYIFCDDLSYENCINALKFIQNDAGRKIEIKSNSSVSGVVYLDRLINFKRLGNQLSVVVWGYSFYFWVLEEKHQKMFSGVCDRFG